MKKQMLQLPEPDADAQQHSMRLVELIRYEINKAGGQIPFDRFMEMALTEPGYGYYVSGNQKFGEAGDFITAPEVSFLFSQCLARQCMEIINLLEGGEKYIVEFGAGSGKMAADILLYLDAQDQLPDEYRIMEISPELRKRQSNTIRNRAPHLLRSVRWIDRLPEKPFRGVVLANEVLDALPVSRFYLSEDDMGELYVCWNKDGFEWCKGEFNTRQLEDRVLQIKNKIGGHYTSEVNFAAEAWVSTVAGLLQQGAMCLIDYGFPADEYYHPQRSEGTLMCHYRHRNHDNPFVYPGLQDITAHVDFSAIAEAAYRSGMSVIGFNTQAMFLLANGLDELLKSADAHGIEYMKLAQQVKTLTMPGEMGELFKVLVTGKGIDHELSGFKTQNFKYKL